MHPLRAATYVRMSTDRQEESPDRQLGQILPYCERAGYVVVKQYSDLGERGWDDNRPGLLQLLKDAQAGLYDVIVVDQLSRLSRNEPIEYISLVLYPLRKAGVKLDAVAEKGRQDWDSLGGVLMTVVEQAKSSGESTGLAHRVQSQYLIQAREGRLYTGKPPYGYRRVKYEDGRPPKMVPGPENEVATVRWLFETYVDRDLSLADLCRQLEARGTLTAKGGTVWKPVTVRKILKDHVYAGYYVFNRRSGAKYFRLAADGIQKARPKMTPKQTFENPEDAWVLIPNAHEPLVSEDLFRAAQEALASNRRRTTPLPDRGDFLLSKFLVCADCGGWMCGLRGGQRRREGYVAYRCSRHTTEGKCNLNIVTEGEVLDRIFQVLQARFLSPVFLQKMRAMAREMDDTASSDQAVARLRSELQDLKKEVERAKRNLSLLPEDLIQGVVADIRRWEARQAEAQRELAASAQPGNAEEVEAVISEIEVMLRDFEQAKLDSNRQALRAVLRRRVAWVEVKVEALPRGTKGSHTYKLVGGKVVLKSGGLLNALAGGARAQSEHLPPSSRSRTQKQPPAPGACFDLISTDRDGEQVCAWTCALSLES